MGEDTGCTCQPPLLVADVDGVHLLARPAETMGPVEALFDAWCLICGAIWQGHYRVDHPTTQVQAHA